MITLPPILLRLTCAISKTFGTLPAGTAVCFLEIVPPSLVRPRMVRVRHYLTQHDFVEFDITPETAGLGTEIEEVRKTLYELKKGALQ
jgi:hypothetical protein